MIQSGENPRILMIHMWFGKMPDYFKYHLKTTKSLPCFDFLIVTDDPGFKVDLPNYRIIKSSPEEISKRLKDKTGLDIEVPSTKKMTDFKVCLADLFESECEGYSHVGFYDIDTLFGNMESVIEAAIEGYDFITVGEEVYLSDRLSGPFVVFQNSEELRKAYLFEQCIKDIADVDRTGPDEKSFSDFVFSKYRVKVIFGQNVNSNAGGKTEYECAWHKGRAYSMGREIVLHHFYHKHLTQFVQLDEDTIITAYDKTLVDDFVWVTGGNEQYVDIMEGLLRSIRKYSNRRCLVYCFNFDWALPADLFACGQFIVRRLDIEPGEVDSRGRDQNLLCVKPKYLLDAIEFMPNSKFAYVDADAAVTVNADSVRDYFSELEYYPLINSHNHDNIVINYNGQQFNSLQILLNRLGLDRTVYPRRKANLIVFDKRSRWFFEEQMEVYEKHRNSEPWIFALHDEDSANALLSKYRFQNSLPVVDIEETRSLDISIYDRYSFNMGGSSPNVRLPKSPNQVLIFHQLKKPSDFVEVEKAYGLSVISQDEIVMEYKDRSVIWQRNVLQPAAQLPESVEIVLYANDYRELFRLSDMKFKNYWNFAIWDVDLPNGIYPTKIFESSTDRVIYSDILTVNN